ncbi:MAG: plasmid stabilization protein [Hydrocarboniphaga sp.]|uniref:type II toxin-antitoxin system RelE/ParE family toxin n=1 Tax=Hydrocarboniphaga sp. TaxID=2033016 RepID=UPI00261ECEA7|nr:type II toxin-antitoxin system RelE/ParE family toxin [Hydrocarboniphaga sp.]MDB5971198.1 plasmid stabilization protein [Hydrocarboniphaga sp.]
MLPYEFHPLAEAELDEAVGYYESVQAGKGLELADQVQAAIEQLCTFPESAPITRGNIRSIVVQPPGRWSYTVHYCIKPSVLRVLAVAHQRRQPFYWFGRR